jgi:hypothetical protein
MASVPPAITAITRVTGPSHNFNSNLGCFESSHKLVAASTFAITQSPMTHDGYKCPTGLVVIRINRALALFHNIIPCPAFALTENTSQ